MQIERSRNSRLFAGKGGGREGAAVVVDCLGNSAAGEAEDGNSIFGGAHRRDSGMEFVLTRAPIAMSMVGLMMMRAPWRARLSMTRV